MKLLARYAGPVLIILAIFVFHRPFFLSGRLPVPADTIVGMYHPFRDRVWDSFTAGVPYKNPLITDPVRQQYVWRLEAVRQLKSGSLPVWNPYSFSGTPLLANIQSAVFYPLNLLYAAMPFDSAWSVQIILSQIIAGLALYYFLAGRGLRPPSALLAGLSFVFSGFAVAWLEWNTVLHSAAWSLAALLAADRIISRKNKSPWYLLFVFSLTAAFLAGHLQIFFYGFILVGFYIAVRLFPFSRKILPLAAGFAAACLIFSVLTLPQWLPSLRLIMDSSRHLSAARYLEDGFFLPGTHLVQLLAPDYFGNPATGNYFGTWNYGEFVSYIGIIPFVLAVSAMMFVRSRWIFFWGSLFFLSLIFALPTLPGRLPFILNLPFLATSQPTRLIFLADLSLAVLAGSGLEYFLATKGPRRYVLAALAAASLMGVLWLFSPSPVSRRNLLLPLIILLAGSLLLFLFRPPGRLLKRMLPARLILVLLFVAVLFDQLRFAGKFTPFSPPGWLFPETEIIRQLKKDPWPVRIMSLDRRILPPNFSVAYRIEDVAGYDPLYLEDYARFVSSWNSGSPQEEAGDFNRIITPDNPGSIAAGLLNVGYFLSLAPLDKPGLTQVAREGETYLYRNEVVFPRVWLVSDLVRTDSRSDELAKVFELGSGLSDTAVTSETFEFTPSAGAPPALPGIIEYGPGLIKAAVSTPNPALLVFSEIYHPSWKAAVNGEPTPVHRVNFLLRAVTVPAGDSVVELYPQLL